MAEAIWLGGMLDTAIGGPHLKKAAEEAWRGAISACVTTWRLSEPHGGQEWLTVPAEAQPGVLTPEEVLKPTVGTNGCSGRSL